MNILFTLLLIAGVAIISIALILGISLGIGWILTLVLSFSLFEGAILGLLAFFTALIIWHHLLNTFAPPLDTYEKDFEEFEDFEDFEEDYYNDEIPITDFYETEEDKTWANWFRYVFANVLYEDFQTTLHISKNLSDALLKDMSLRLADATVEGLRKKTAQARQIRVTKGMLKHEMNEAGLKPYDEDILDFAMTVINTELDYMEDEIRATIEKRAWDKRATVI